MSTRESMSHIPLAFLLEDSITAITASQHMLDTQLKSRILSLTLQSEELPAIVRQLSSLSSQSLEYSKSIVNILEGLVSHLRANTRPE